MRRCSWLLIAALCAGAGPASAAPPPPRRDLADVKAVLARAPKVSSRELRPINILLVANRKDHGPHEHDYPRWMERWKVLLGGKSAGSSPVTMYGLTSDLPAGPKPGAPKVTVETAVDWPTPEQLRRADVMVAFMGTGGIWNEAKLRDLKSLLDRGAGFVGLHAAVIAEKPHAKPLADLIGLAWEGGYTTFRHGALDLTISDRNSPITQGLPEKIHFEDESYWPLVGDAKRVNVLATAEETERGRLTPQPMFWTHTAGKGRVFNSILGHYTWTFDDPYFRILVLRGIAWAAGEPPTRFDPLVLSGARVTDRPAVAATPTAAKKAAPTPVAPDAADPGLLLWLDASDAATLTTAPDGRVSAWANKASRTSGKLVSEGSRQPLLVPKALGDRPALRFDGVDDVLRHSAFRQGEKEWAVALVITPRANSGTFRALLAANRPGVDDFQSGFNIDLGPGGGSTFNSVNLEGIKGGGATNLRTASAPFGSGQVLILTTGAGSSRLWVNGEPEGARGASDAVTQMEELRLGGRFYFGGERGFFEGDISEVLLYRGQLSDQQAAGLSAHLMKKYGPGIQPPAAIAIDPWDYLPTYDWGGTRRPLTAINEAVARSKSDPRLRKTLETRFAELIGDPANTAASRDYACRQLAVIGSDASVPTLAKLLNEPLLSTMACFALERIPGPQADRALVKSLPTLAGRPRVEVIQALGSRRVRTSVAALAPLLQDGDAAVRSAAITALGNIGGPDAVSALLSHLTQAPESEKVASAGALLQCADELVQTNGKAEAERLYERLSLPGIPAATRSGAIAALVRLRGAASVPFLIEQLNNKDPSSRAAVLLLIGSAEDKELTQRIASELELIAPEARAQVITVIADRGDRSAVAGIRKAAASEEPVVRMAAIRALGRLGDVADVPALLTAAAAEDGDLSLAAKNSLAALAGTGVDAMLLKAAEEGPPTLRAAAITALGRRGTPDAATVLTRAARGDEAIVRSAAIEALGASAAVADMPVLVEVLIRPKTPGDAQAAEKAIAAVYGRTEEKERWVDGLLAAIPGANTEGKAALLRSLTLNGGTKALLAVKTALSDPDPELQDEALGILADWENPEAADTLLSLVKSTRNPIHRTLALRGYLRMAGLSTLPAARRLDMIRQGLELAQRDDERRLVLAALAGVPTLEALKMVSPFVERDGLSEEAAAAAVAIAGKLLPAEGAAVIEVMDRIRAKVKNEDLLRQAAELRTRAGGK